MAKEVVKLSLTPFSKCQEADSALLGDIMVTRDALDDLIVASLTHALTTSKSVLASVSTVTGKVGGECRETGTEEVKPG